MISDGSDALIVTTADRAKDYPNKPIYVLGMAEQSELRGDYFDDYLMRPFLKKAAKQIWTSTGFSPSDIDLLYIQDPTAAEVRSVVSVADHANHWTCRQDASGL